MKKNKAFFIPYGIFVLIAVFIGLWFMGLFSFAGNNRRAASSSDASSYHWEIVYHGMKFSSDVPATVYFHETDCLNIRIKKEYLIQISSEDITADDFWSNKEDKVKHLIDAGYRMECDPRQLTADNRTYINYIVSISDLERSPFDRCYSSIYITDIDEGSRFFATISYDGIDMENMSNDKRDELYKDAEKDLTDLLNAAAPTDQADDEVGTLLFPDDIQADKETIISQDALYDKGDIVINYYLPDNAYFISDTNLSTIKQKNYKIKDTDYYVSVSIYSNKWSNAEELAGKHASAGFTEITHEGSLTVGGKVFYYYTYSVARRSKVKTEVTYYFEAFSDMDNGNIYHIGGHSNSEDIMNPDFYYGLMDISEP
ncbi:MAG: hypothetical protein NC393_14270 [Clostridium sp.]|nr:hypothetical protein [Clostridium sp.]MCM1173277.1 hypothetical protein [Clostridium sp.]